MRRRRPAGPGQRPTAPYYLTHYQQGWPARTGSLISGRSTTPGRTLARPAQTLAQGQTYRDRTGHEGIDHLALGRRRCSSLGHQRRAPHRDVRQRRRSRLGSPRRHDGRARLRPATTVDNFRSARRWTTSRATNNGTYFGACRLGRRPGRSPADNAVLVRRRRRLRRAWPAQVSTNFSIEFWFKSTQGLGTSAPMVARRGHGRRRRERDEQRLRRHPVPAARSSAAWRRSGHDHRSASVATTTAPGTTSCSPGPRRRGSMTLYVDGASCGIRHRQHGRSDGFDATSTSDDSPPAPATTQGTWTRSRSTTPCSPGPRSPRTTTRPVGAWLVHSGPVKVAHVKSLRLPSGCARHSPRLVLRIALPG